MEQERLAAVGILIVKLAVIVRLGKAAAQRRHAGRHTGDGQGEVIRPRLCRHDDLDAIREHTVDLRHVGLEFIHKGLEFVRGADLIRRSFIHRGKLKVDIRDHLAHPLGMDAEDLVVSAGGPVVARVAHAPLFRRHGAEHQRLFGLIAAVDQSLGNAHHQGDGGVIILEAGKVGIVVGAHQHQAFRVAAGDHADNIVRRAVLADTAVRVQRDGGFAVLIHRGLEEFRVRAAHRKGGRVGRTADVLCVQRIVAHLAIAAVLHGDHGCRAGKVRFIGGVVDPPVGTLVDVHQHQLPGHIQSGKVRFGAPAAVDDRIDFGTVGHKVRLVAAKLRRLHLAGAVRKAELRSGECPGIQRKFVLGDILQADALHLFLEHIAGGDLRLRARRAVAELLVAANVLQLHRQVIGIVHVHLVEVGLRGISLGLRGILGILLAAGGRG